MAKEKLNTTPGEVDAAMAKNLPPFEVWYTGRELTGKTAIRMWLIVFGVGALITLVLSLVAVNVYDRLLVPAQYLTVTGICIGVAGLIAGIIGLPIQWTENTQRLRQAKAEYCDWLDQLVLARSTQVVSEKQDAQAT